jgi:hypothetical protein
MFGRINAARFARLAAVLLLPVLCFSLTIPTKKTLRESQLEDLEIAKPGYLLKSKAFTPQVRERALTLVAQLKHPAGQLSDAQFLLGRMKITGLANNAHDSVDFGDDAWNPTTHTPFRLLWFPGAMIVARAAICVAVLPMALADSMRKNGTFAYFVHSGVELSLCALRKHDWPSGSEQSRSSRLPVSMDKLPDAVIGAHAGAIAGLHCRPRMGGLGIAPILLDGRPPQIAASRIDGKHAPAVSHDSGDRSAVLERD